MFRFLSNQAELELIKTQIGQLIVINSNRSLSSDRWWFISVIFTDTACQMFTPLKQDETIKKEYERIQLNRWSLLFFFAWNRVNCNCSIALSTDKSVWVFRLRKKVHWYEFWNRNRRITTDRLAIKFDWIQIC